MKTTRIAEAYQRNETVISNILNTSLTHEGVTFMPAVRLEKPIRFGRYKKKVFDTIQASTFSAGWMPLPPETARNPEQFKELNPDLRIHLYEEEIVNNGLQCVIAHMPFAVPQSRLTVDHPNFRTFFRAEHHYVEKGEIGDAEPLLGKIFEIDERPATHVAHLANLTAQSLNALGSAYGHLGFEEIDQLASNERHLYLDHIPAVQE